MNIFLKNIKQPKSKHNKPYKSTLILSPLGWFHERRTEKIR